MLNCVNLIGRLTKNPELKTTTSGLSVVSFTLAVDRSYAKQGGEKITDFINCVAWRKTAEFLSQYFKKGSLLALQGSIQTRTWNDNEGKRHYVTEVAADHIHLMESRKNAGEPSPYDQSTDGNYGYEGIYSQASPAESYSQLPPEEDLPF